MSDDKKGGDNVHRLWHERLEDSDIKKFANDLISKFLSMGVKVHTINVYWDKKGNFITKTQGAHFKRRVEDKKTPENH